MFLETIRIENNKISNTQQHNKRVNRTIYENYKIKSDIRLEEHIDKNYSSITKCRIIYNKEIIKVEYHKYKPKTIKSLKVVESDIEYRYKFTNRETINSLLDKNFDDIIISNNGLIRDTSFANIAIRLDGIWYTPKNYLLLGATLSKMLIRRRVIPKDITKDELQKAQKFAIINSMIGFKIIKGFSIC
jgi:4-amino-4-deoxychorismate lyase